MAEPPPIPRGDPPQPPEDPEFPGKSPIPPNSPQTRRRSRTAERTRLRNRRYAALRELIRGGEYFSEEQMRLRAPRLFRHYIGRFREPQRPQNPQNHPKIPQNHPKTLPGDPKIPQNHPKNPPKDPQMPRNLRELLLSALEESDAQDEEDEDEDEDDDDDEEEEDEGRVPAAEQELLRLEFTTRMYQRFLEGQDGDFDYSQVDENPDLDDLELVGQDLEDRWFDEEEPSPAPLLD